MSDSLSVIQGITVTSSMLISSTVPEIDYTAYNPATAYTLGQRCISTTTHRIYESAASSTGKDPTDVNNRIGTTPYWIDKGATNHWKMFDRKSNSPTVATSPFTFVMKAGAFNASYLGGLDADSITISVKAYSGAPTDIFTVTDILEGSAPPDYYEHFYERFRPLTSFLAQNIDAYIDMEITVTLSSASGTVKCGNFTLGDLRPLGNTMYGVTVTPKSFSSFVEDGYGYVDIVSRGASKDMELKAHLKLSEAAIVDQILMELQDVPSVWIAHPAKEYAATRIFGLGVGRISYDHPTDCILSLTVKGFK